MLLVMPFAHQYCQRHFAEVKTTSASTSSLTGETVEEKLMRERRDVVIKTALEAELNDDHEDENLAIEEVTRTKLKSPPSAESHKITFPPHRVMFPMASPTITTW